MSLVRIENLNMAFGGIVAVKDLSFAIESGMIYSIIGPNGAGKTTLFNLISGLYTPTEGKIFLEDVDITGQPPHELASLGLSRTFQNLQIFFNMTALENVMVGHHLHCDTRFLHSLFGLPSITRSDRQCRDYAAEMMAYIGLEDHIDVASDSLPYGALKRLEIGRALATKPKVLLLDEPAAGLNPTETKTIVDLIRKIADDGITVMLVEHDMHLIWGVSDHILVLDHGEKLAEGTAEEISTNKQVIASYLGQQAKGH